MTEPESSSSPETAKAPAMSLGGRLVNIFVEPGEVFDEVKASPPTLANWLAPMAIMAIMSIIFSMVAFSQPTVVQAMKAAPEKKIQEMVDSGKISRQVADQQLGVLDKIMTPTVFKVAGIGMSLIMPAVMIFFSAFVIWLIGTHAFGGSLNYMKTAEATALSGMVTVPTTLVYMLLVVIYGNLGMTPGPILLVGHFDAAVRMDRVLSAIELGTVWWTVILAVALSRLTGGSFMKSALWCFGVWALLKVAPAIFIGG